jgi:hypothetical protein
VASSALLVHYFESLAGSIIIFFLAPFRAGEQRYVYSPRLRTYQLADSILIVRIFALVLNQYLCTWSRQQHACCRSPFIIPLQTALDRLSQIFGVGFRDRIIPTSDNFEYKRSLISSFKRMFICAHLI